MGLNELKESVGKEMSSNSALRSLIEQTLTVLAGAAVLGLLNYLFGEKGE